jgi:hypothetical protein
MLACAVLATTPPLASTEEPDGRPFLFPAGTYVLGSSSRPATGKDICTLREPFALHADQYILSGGPRPTDSIVIDDDLEVLRGKTLLFVDDDHVRAGDRRAGIGCTYDGAPIILALPQGAVLRIRAIDHAPTEAILGELYLHRSDGARWLLVRGRKAASNDRLPHTFFDETFRIAAGFDRPLARVRLRPGPDKLAAWWGDLGATDAGKGFVALWALAAAPEQAVPFLKEHLPPVASIDAAQRDRIARLIAELDSDTFAVRERAMTVLRRDIDVAEPALRAARGRAAPEARRRIEELLEKRAEVAIPTSDDLRASRAVEALEHMRTADARQLLEQLATGAASARRTREAAKALERLADAAKPTP